MGIIRGYICSSCNFEKNYFLGISFSNQKLLIKHIEPTKEVATKNI